LQPVEHDVEQFMTLEHRVAVLEHQIKLLVEWLKYTNTGSLKNPHSLEWERKIMTVKEHDHAGNTD
jgi:hypothetical protein